MRIEIGNIEDDNRKEGVEMSKQETIDLTLSKYLVDEAERHWEREHGPTIGTDTSIERILIEWISTRPVEIGEEI